MTPLQSSVTNWTGAFNIEGHQWVQFVFFVVDKDQLRSHDPPSKEFLVM